MKNRWFFIRNGGLLGVLAIFVLSVAVLAFVGCPGDGRDTQIPEKYKDFFNYPDGRKNSGGTLQIKNGVAFSALLFIDSVSPANYIGTVESLNSIKVRLPEQKFYTIVAVDKANWEERGAQAAQYSELTYFSNTQPYSINVYADKNYGNGTWYIYNQTDYWVQFKDMNQSGIVYAVAPPQARRFSVPIQIGKNIDYIPSFYKELKYENKVIALVESDLPSEMDTVVTSAQNPNFYTDIGGLGIQPPSNSIKPAILFSTSADRSVRVFSGTNKQLSAIGMLPGEDFALASGSSQMFTDLEAGINVNSINALLPSGDRKYVTENMPMVNGKVYRIAFGGNATNGYTFTVTEEEASLYFN